MSRENEEEREELLTDGDAVRFVLASEDTWSVVASDDDREIGGRALFAQGPRFIAYRRDGTVLTKPSRGRGGGRLVSALES